MVRFRFAYKVAHFAKRRFIFDFISITFPSLYKRECKVTKNPAKNKKKEFRLLKQNSLFLGGCPVGFEPTTLRTTI